MELIENKLRNSFRAVKRDITELKDKYNTLNDINNNLIELAKEIKELRNENSKLRDEIEAINNKLDSNKKNTNERFKRVSKDVNNIAVSSGVDKLAKKTDKQIKFLKDRFVTKEDISDLNIKIDRALVSNTYLKKLDLNIDYLKNNLNKKYSENIEELKSNVAKIKTVNQNVINNKKKGFLTKKFEEVVDILAEDED